MVALAVVPVNIFVATSADEYVRKSKFNLSFCKPAWYNEFMHSSNHMATKRCSMLYTCTSCGSSEPFLMELRMAFNKQLLPHTLLNFSPPTLQSDRYLLIFGYSLFYVS